MFIQIKEFIFGTVAQGEPAYVEPKFYTVLPESEEVLPFNDWALQHKVSTRFENKNN